MIKTVLKIIFALAGIVLLIWFLIQIQTILAYLLVAWIVALIGRPIYNLFGRLHIRGRILPAGVRSILTMLIIFCAIGMVIAMFLPLIFFEIKHLSQLDTNDIRASVDPLITWLKDIGGRFNIESMRELDEAQILTYIYNSINFGAIPDMLNAVLGIFGNTLVAVFSVAFITFFFLKDRDMSTNLILYLVPASKEENMRRIVVNTRLTLSRYFLGLVMQITAVALCVFVGLSIVGVENALLIAFFSGLANLIPYLGPWIGALFGLFILVSNNIDASFAEVVKPKIYGLLIVYAITQMIDNYILQPTIFSNSIHAHPLEIFIVILIAGTLGGVIGMIVAVPLYAFFRIVFMELNREFRFLENIKSK